MSDKASELFEAAKALLPFLEASDDELYGFWKNARELTRAERLRLEADEIEARDAAIKRFRAAVAAFRPPDGHADIQAAIRAELERK